MADEESPTGKEQAPEPSAADTVEALLANGGWPTLNLNGAVTMRKARSLILMMREMRKADATRPITLVIDSPGGELPAGLRIYDAMQEVGNVHTHCSGQAQSMAGILLLAGEPGHRSASKHALIMLHGVRAHAVQTLGTKWATREDFRAAARGLDRDMRILSALIAEHTGQSPDAVKHYLRKDREFTGGEARDAGIVDVVVGPAMARRTPVRPTTVWASKRPTAQLSLDF